MQLRAQWQIKALAISMITCLCSSLTFCMEKTPKTRGLSRDWCGSRGGHFDRKELKKLFDRKELKELDVLKKSKSKVTQKHKVTQKEETVPLIPPLPINKGKDLCSSTNSSPATTDLLTSARKFYRQGSDQRVPRSKQKDYYLEAKVNALDAAVCVLLAYIQNESDIDVELVTESMELIRKIEKRRIENTASRKYIITEDWIVASRIIEFIESLKREGKEDRRNSVKKYFQQASDLSEKNKRLRITKGKKRKKQRKTGEFEYRCGKDYVNRAVENLQSIEKLRTTKGKKRRTFGFSMGRKNPIMLQTEDLKKLNNAEDFCFQSLGCFSIAYGKQYNVKIRHINKANECLKDIHFYKKRVNKQSDNIIHSKKRKDHKKKKPKKNNEKRKNSF